MKDTIIKNKPAHIDGGLERSRFQSKLVGGKTKKNKKPMRKTMKKKNGGNLAKGISNLFGMRTKSPLIKKYQIKYKEHTLNMLSKDEEYINWWTCKFKDEFGDTYTGKDKCTAFSFLSMSRQINRIYQKYKDDFIDFQKEHDNTAKKYLDKLPTPKEEDKADKTNKSLKQPDQINKDKEILIISTQYELSDVVLNDAYTDDFIRKLQTICFNHESNKNIKETCKKLKEEEEKVKKKEEEKLKKEEEEEKVIA